MIVLDKTRIEQDGSRRAKSAVGTKRGLKRMTGKEKDEKGSSEQKLIRELAELLNETGLSEIEIEKSGLKVRVARTLP